MTNTFKTAFTAAVILLAAFAAVFIGALVLMAIGVEPIAVYKVILTDPLRDLYGITEILVRSVPLILIALGISVAFRSGILNIGAEGQMQIGIISAAAVAIALPDLPKPLLLPLVLLTGSVCARARRPPCAPARPRSNTPARTTPTLACSSTAEAGQKRQKQQTSQTGSLLFFHSRTAM